MLLPPVKTCVHRLVNEPCVHTQMLFPGKNRETKKILRMDGRKRDQRRGTRGKLNEERVAEGHESCEVRL